MESSTVTSTAVADVMQEVDDAVVRKQLLESDARRMDREAEFLKRIVWRNANPNPSVVAACVIAVMGALYLIYLAAFKPNASGEWYDNDNNQWIIEHDRWSNAVSVIFCGNRLPPCIVVDNMFRCAQHVGIWDYHDTIMMLNGNKLRRVRQ